ncbi:ABC transporter permease subunit [Caulobacter sp. SLTY]|uniref:ABC transporter permease subunit n=1 Tax=Caulobacter sp. SLTY TaxID=2683262 RepID=UPI0014120B46|nr:ABC transporter permease subunit [Caulobacter sp. SLTY]NBB16220.1 ABC transporter permease subunit [Caulobacter sp. SLTY]
MKRTLPRLSALIPYAWLLVFFALPFLLVLRLSLSDSALAIPPYTPRIDWGGGIDGVRAFIDALDFDTYKALVGDSLYFNAYISSLRFALEGTVLALLVGYPMAYGMARCKPGTRSLLLMAVILPFWTSFLIRVYAWVGILKPQGLLNAGLGLLGLPDADLLYTPAAVQIGLVYSYLPFMVLPLYAALEKQDHTLLEAAADLGSPPWKSFWQVTFPLSIPGVIAGCLLCFIPMVGEFVIPDLLGGPGSLMIGRSIWMEFFANRDWPFASAVAIVLLITLVVPIVLYQRQQVKALEAGR